ncbi:hypothetical protein LZZ85_00370 [Terrimonas sp. NA20]|uniref:Uncharacterized protein n=1 Tax=Terrimonas ginsenosidimutans TaxID=2908004 RepID=A0ABS9KK58_9BACT|nr:hypothetical protein [Terrimonas ginsenosidimutans]MCG2612704.1 hypothetical protein [Terrimonas ginsenosidimutans]
MSWKKIGGTLLILPCLFACKNNNPSSDNVLTIANDGLLQSITSAKQSTENVLLALQEKKADPLTAPKANVVEPKALAVDDQANDLVSRIEKIKDQLWQERNSHNVSEKILQQTAGLPDLFFSFRNTILLNNPDFINQVDSMPPLFAEHFDQRIIKGESINKLLFESISPSEAILILSRFQLNIRELALKSAVIMLQGTHRVALICTFVSPMIAQSHQVLKPNGQLTIELALGEIRYRGLQQVKMNGKELSLNETGTYKARFTAPSIAGKYKIPVVASFTDQDGKEQTIQKDITYEVMSCEVSNIKEQKE